MTADCLCAFLCWLAAVAGCCCACRVFCSLFFYVCVALSLFLYGCSVQIRVRASHVFDDAREDLASPDALKTRLELWSSRYPEEYAAAYMSSSAPSLFAPYVRLELLRWDAAKDHHFDAHNWYQLLLNYGVGEQT